MPDEGGRGGDAGSRLMSPKALLPVVNNVVGAILGTAALILIAKNMGPRMMGILGYSMAYIGILSFLSDFGAGSVHRMLIKSGEDAGKCVGAYAAIRLVLLAIFAIIAFVMIELWRRNGLGGTMPENFQIINSLQVFLLYYVLLGVSQIATHTFDALDKVASVYVPSILDLVVRVSFIVYVATSLVGRGPYGPALLASSYVVGMIASTLLVAFLMLNVKITKPDRALLMKYIRSLVPVFVVTMIIVVDLYLDKAIVGYFWGEVEVGLFFGVQKMAIFVSVFSLSVATLILPSVTTYYTRKDVAASWDIVNQAERYVSLIVIPLAAFYLMWGSQMLTIFLTQEFVSAVNVMDLLVISSTLVALVLPLRSAIAGAGSPTTLFWVGAVGLALQVVLMLIFVPKEIYGFPMFGMKGLGAAFALLLTSIYLFFMLRYMAWRTAKIVPNSRSFKHLMSAIVMVGAMYVVAWLFFGTIDWIDLVLLAIVGFFSYSLTAYGLGELELSDYRYFMTLLKPQGTLQYVMNEMLGRRAQ
jgi:O-antigen/teichoic acid export membrane protein